MYKIIDLQGGGLKADYRYNTKQEVIEALASFHDTDWTDEIYPSIYDLLHNQTEKEKLEFLCDYGKWEIEEVKVAKDIKWETDGQEVTLPTTVELPTGIADCDCGDLNCENNTESVNNYLSNKFGFLVSDYTITK